MNPEQRIIDTHLHLWDRVSNRYLLEDFQADAVGHNVADSVFVECMTCYRKEGPEALRPVGETEFVAGQVHRSPDRKPRVSAIVGYADLRLGDGVVEVLDAHEEAGRGLFRGTRHRAAWDPRLHEQFGNQRDADALDDSQFQRGVRQLGRHGYTFDVLVYHPQLLALTTLARAVEGTTFIINHFGGPLGVPPFDRDAAEVASAWRTGLRQLGDCQNVILKIGGFGIDWLCGLDWETTLGSIGSDSLLQRWGDDIRWCIDTFGPSRCVLESNYPIDRRVHSYPVIWNAFQKLAPHYNQTEQDALFAGTASRVYRIS